jgi:hypothetical protein
MMTQQPLLSGRFFTSLLRRSEALRGNSMNGASSALAIHCSEAARFTPVAKQ